jgi:hypothetical protein
MTATSTIAPVLSREASAITAPTQLIETRLETYAYRRFGGGAGPPLVFLQHFTGTLDNWDPAVADQLAGGREIVLFESAGVGRSTGEVPTTIAGMAAHFLALADALGLIQIDLPARCCWSAPPRQAVRTSCTWRNRNSGTSSRTPHFRALGFW